MRNWSIGWLLPTSTDGKRSSRTRRPRAPAAMARTAIGRFSARPSRRRRGRCRPPRSCSYPAIFSRTIFAVISMPRPAITRTLPIACASGRRCSLSLCSLPLPSRIHRSCPRSATTTKSAATIGCNQTDHSSRIHCRLFAPSSAVSPALVFDRDWASHGNYSVRMRTLRIIFPNTVFFSLHYQNACGSADLPDPAQATLAWLETELAAARQARERVWLVDHIPPGVDGFATLQHGSCPSEIIPMWNQGYAAPFDALLRRNADTIAASFAGHTHMDDFRLLGEANGYYGFTLITPALSPIFGQNPAFRTVVYDPAGPIVDHTTYYLANLEAAAAAGGHRRP